MKASRRLRRLSLLSAACALGVAFFAASVSAQNSQPNALQGFSQNRNEPVKIDAATLETLKTDDALLTKILTYHVIPGQIAPDKIVGSQTSVEKGAVTVTGTPDALKVNDANVICGGVKTANATVYLIDSVLMPTS